jgi:hypothetical protein
MTSALVTIALLAGAPAQHAVERQVQSPIWVAAWGTVDGDYPHIASMVTLPGDFRPGQQGESVNAEELAAQLKARPARRRAVLLLRYCHSFWGHRGDLVHASNGREYMGPWADDACAGIAKDWPRVLALTKYCGGTIDLLVGDFEECGLLGTWWMKDDQMEAVRADARWKEPRAGLPPLGDTLRDLDRLSPAEIKNGTGTAYKLWNLATKRIAAAYMNRALWESARAEFPAIVGSNYQGQRMVDQPAPDLNGHQQPRDNVFGNAASPSLYGEVGGITNQWIDPGNPSRVAWNGTSRLARVPWSSFLLCLQEARACVRSAPDIPLMPWIANPSYAGDDPANPIVPFPKDLRTYDESIRHAALLGVPTFLWWRQDSKSSPADTSRIDWLVSEINARTLGRIKEAADVAPISFLSEVVVSGGRRHDGRWLWRVSASPEVAALREAGTGKEWVPTPDTLGFWVETAERVAPRWEVARRRTPQAPGS